MNIRNKQKKPDFSPKILDRKTDSSGRTFYQIQWISNSALTYDNNTASVTGAGTGTANSNMVTWVPLTNLKQYYKIIQEFQMKYQERVVDWVPISRGRDGEGQGGMDGKEGLGGREGIGLGNKRGDGDKMGIEKQKEKKGQDRDRMVDEEEDQIEKQFQILIQQKNKVNTSDRSLINKQSAQLVPTQPSNKQSDISFTPKQQGSSIDRSIQLQPTKKKPPTPTTVTAPGSSTPAAPLSKPQIKQLNQRLTKLIRKSAQKPHPKKLKKKSKRRWTRLRGKTDRQVVERERERERVLRIKDVFVGDGIWFANVVVEGGDGEMDKVVLRDALRVCQPEVLLGFYEGLLEQKRKDLLI